jgi:hypothetical protein
MEIEINQANTTDLTTVVLKIYNYRNKILAEAHE